MTARRLFTCVGASAVLGLSLFGASASAQTVHDYVYSGQYIDGTGSDIGQFNTATDISGVAFDKSRHRILVAIGAPFPESAKIVAFKENGVPDEFAGLATGTDTINAGFSTGFPAAIDVDNTAGAGNGTFYLTTSGGSFSSEVGGWSAAGVRGAQWPRFVENVCGVTVGPEGFAWTMGSIGGAGLQPRLPSGASAGSRIDLWPYITKDQERGLSGDTACRQKLDSQSNLYGVNINSGNFKWTKYAPDGSELFELSQAFGGTAAAIDLSNDDVVTIEGSGPEPINLYDREGKKLETFGGADPGHSYEGLVSPGGLAVDPETHDIWISNLRSYGGARRVEKFERDPTGIVVPTVSVEQVEGDDLQGATAVLRGTVNPDGLETATCRFKWGLTQSVTNTVPCDQGQNLAGSGDIAVTATVPTGKGKVHYYRLESENKANGRPMLTGPKRFIGQGKAVIEVATVDRVNTDGARFNADIDPNGGDASWTFEYGSGPGFESSTPLTSMATLTQSEHVTRQVTGLTAGTAYHVRLAVTSEAGTVYSETQFLTYAPEPGTDNCVNALPRQQSGSSKLLDCRGYELVSARNAGGYDIVSDLLKEEPLIGPPGARDKLLYSVDSGAIPGIAGNPTNLGRDPYIATRDPDTSEWTTSYVGLPANGMTQKGPYGSPLLGTDGSLNQFAFGGAEICNPCFADNSTNIPLRRANGVLEKGMAGTTNPAANPSQHVAQPFSADGSHFVFGSEPKFEPTADEAGSIYDRNLDAGTTQVVSTTPAGTAITGGDVGELAISADGERIVVGQELGTDGSGNLLWHLYMHLGTSPNSIDLTEDAGDGVLFSGMTADGSRLFMTSVDELLPEDTDESADIYEAAVNGDGDLALRLVTTKGGAVSNDDSCTPAGIPDSWNVASGTGRCDAVAFAGGAGVASENGTLYFVSPEQLDGSEGKANQGNLYVVAPDGDPNFVAVLDTSEGKPGPQPPGHPLDDEEFAGAFADPRGLEVDQSNGDVWVAETGSGTIHRFDSSGAPRDFTAGPGSGTNEIGGFNWIEPSLAQIAIDSSSGPTNGNIYVVHSPGFNGRLDVFAPTGALLTTLSGSGLPGGMFGGPCGVDVDETNGDVYVGDFYGRIWRYSPSGAVPAEGDYSGGVLTGSFSSSCGVAVSGASVYTNLFEYGEVVKYQKSDFALSPTEPEAPLLASGATGVSSDQSTGLIYVDQGNKISVYDSSGDLRQTVGAGLLFNSSSVAVNEDSGHVFATVAGEGIVEFGSEPIAYDPIDNTAILHGARQPSTHSYEDFQVSSDGRFAAFATKQQLTDFNNIGFEEVYRYDADGEAIDCASCAPSGAAPSGDTGLAKHGLAMTDDGRVFFTSAESFALRDTNEKLDAYEWNQGKTQLISQGLGPEDSALLTVTPDGTDAFFFTRDTLVPEDENGSTVKVYDAREFGGTLHDPALHPCAASDECHGPGSQTPPPPDINSQKGSGRSFEPPAEKKCRKGFKKKNGKCVKKKTKKRNKKSKRGGRR